MLSLILGKAGAGKTAEIIKQIRNDVENHRGKNIYLVPEQYSFEAERELCRACPDSLSLYAEVMSFTGLAREIGRICGGAEKYLDDGGKLLCMALTTDLLSKGGMLKSFGYAAGKSETQDMLVSAMDELYASGITAKKLYSAAETVEGSLQLKLRDLALISETYSENARLSGAECGDRLEKTADGIRTQKETIFSHVYIDGFTDFTAGESAVIESLLENGSDITVCLTTDSLDTECEAFFIPSATGRKLLEAAARCGCDSCIIHIEAGSTKTEAIRLFSDEMFSYKEKLAEDKENAISLRICSSPAAECELAAAECLRLVRETGCRWRDIAIAIRDYDEYRTILKSIFENYSVPLFAAERRDITGEPLPVLIACAYEIARNGWQADDVISYMRTGLTGLSTEECDLLENYIFKWSIDERGWHSCGVWKQNPEGYKGKPEEASEKKLELINEAGKKLSQPLMRFVTTGRSLQKASEHCENLAHFMRELNLDSVMENMEGENNAEIQRVWDICITALEQCMAVLGETEINMTEFGRLFMRMLSKYSLSCIPASLDSVSAGDFNRMRRRDIRHLIVLGADDSRLPKAVSEEGIFTPEERLRLLDTEIILDAGEDEMWREFSLIYNCLSLPSETLTLSCSAADAEGGKLLPSFVMAQARRLFSKEYETGNVRKARLSSELPALSLAALSGKIESPEAQAAEAYFMKLNPERLEKIKVAANCDRGQLSPSSVEGLYGKTIKLSATRSDSFINCPFGYFCNFGLKAEPYEPAEFSPLEVGSFMHKIFENTSADVVKLGGFKVVGEEKLFEIADGHIEAYIRDELGGFDEKSQRFVYLFNRLRGDVHAILSDAAEELKQSLFTPSRFELDMGKSGMMPEISLEGGTKITLTGIADRIDEYEQDGELYLRVVDYKTGSKDFKLGDVYEGLNMQMLLYLMALENGGATLFKKPVKGAGIVYFPARDKIVPAKDSTDEAIEKERINSKRRSGLVLNEEAVIKAWDTGEDKRFTPVKKPRAKDAVPEALADGEQMQALMCFIKDKLGTMGKNICRGEIAAAPMFTSENENACAFCKYADACGFTDGERGEHFKVRENLKAPQVWEKIMGEKENG